MKLEIENVSMHFGKRASRVDVLNGVSLSVEQNEFVSLVGVSGCGKSTLLSLVAGLLQPTGGSIRLDGAGIRGPGADRGVVFQAYTLLPWLTAQQNVEFALKQMRPSEPDVGGRARQLLHDVGLDGFTTSYPNQLSGGMRQRVAIARVLAYRPKMMLMDEPFGALDALTRSLMQELLTQVWEEHKLTVLFVTHDIDEAVFLSDRVVVMSADGGESTVLPVDLPRPRVSEMTESREFRALRGELLELVRDEARAANHFAT